MSSSGTGSDADPADYLAGLRAVLDTASSEASSGTSAGAYLPSVCLGVLKICDVRSRNATQVPAFVAC